MLLRVETNDEGGDVDNLLADTDVTLTDQDTGVMDGLSETEFVDLGLFGVRRCSCKGECGGGLECT